MSVRLFVGGLSFTTSTERLREAFARYGGVDSAAVMTDRETGRSRGFGFVEMSSTGGRRAGHRRPERIEPRRPDDPRRQGDTARHGAAPERRARSAVRARPGREALPGRRPPSRAAPGRVGPATGPAASAHAPAARRAAGGDRATRGPRTRETSGGAPGRRRDGEGQGRRAPGEGAPRQWRAQGWSRSPAAERRSRPPQSRRRLPHLLSPARRRHRPARFRPHPRSEKAGPTLAYSEGADPLLGNAGLHPHAGPPHQPFRRQHRLCRGARRGRPRDHPGLRHGRPPPRPRHPEPERAPAAHAHPDHAHPLGSHPGLPLLPARLRAGGPADLLRNAGARAHPRILDLGPDAAHVLSRPARPAPGADRLRRAGRAALRPRPVPGAHAVPQPHRGHHRLPLRARRPGLRLLHRPRALLVAVRPSPRAGAPCCIRARSATSPSSRASTS